MKVIWDSHLFNLKNKETHRRNFPVRFSFYSDISRQQQSDRSLHNEILFSKSLNKPKVLLIIVVLDALILECYKRQ